MKDATSFVLAPAGRGRGRGVARRNLDDKKQEKLLRKHCENLLSVITSTLVEVLFVLI